MILVSAIIKELHALGVTGDALVATIERIEKSGVTAGALRMRRHRTKTETATSDAQVTDKVSSLSSSLSLSPNTPIPFSPSIPSSNTHGAHGTRLPEMDSIPSTWMQFSLELGMPPPLINSTFSGFCDYWRAVPGSKGRKADWTATWRNWCRRDLEKKNGKSEQKPTWTSEGDRLAAKYAAQAMAERGQNNPQPSTGENLRLATPIREEFGGIRNTG